MASRIQGITVEIGGDTTKLQNALKGVNGQIKSTQSQLKDVNKLLKLDSGNTELLAQKHKLLAEAVGETKEKLATLKTAAEQANTALANGEISQEQYDAIQREIVETEQDLKNLETQANQSATAVQKIATAEENLKTTGDNISSAGHKLLPVTAGVTALGTASVTTAANFESSMSQVQATMGITKDSMSKVNGQSVNTMDTLSKLAKKMGAETAFSASECAEAFNYLALAGYDTQQMCDTLPTVLNLAAAGDIQLASASDMVTDAMSALGMGVDEAGTMVDQMAKTASTTNTSVAQLGEGILTIGATAKSIKGGTAELNTALGILANNGIKGAEGGTHLRNIILSLQSPTDAAAKQMEASDAKLFLIKMQQEDGRGHSTIKTVRGVLRPAFQMAVDDDVLMKNPFQFELAGVVVNDAVTREAITKDQMRRFLKFIHDDVVYCKYYEVIYILFHTGMRISEFCGLTMRDIDLEKRTINIDHQLQRTSKREYVIEPTKTNAGTRVIPMTNEVTEMFRAIIEDRTDYKVEKVVDGYTGFLFLDKDGMPLVAMHWEHRFNHMVSRYNEIYKVQMPNITPHVCRHTYCSNMAKSGMNPKTLQYLMGHSDIAVTLNVHTHVGLEDAEKELQKMQGLENARKEMEISDTDDKPLKQNMFKVV